MTRLRTALCDRLGIDLPIVQAPVGSAAVPEPVAAVSEAGGLGMLIPCLGEKLPIHSTFWGDPSPVHGRIHRAGALRLHTLGDIAEAVHAVAAVLALGARDAVLGTRLLHDIADQAAATISLLHGPAT